MQDRRQSNSTEPALRQKSASETSAWCYAAPKGDVSGGLPRLTALTDKSNTRKGPRGQWAANSTGGGYSLQPERKAYPGAGPA